MNDFDAVVPWNIVIPVKGGPDAKRRLAAPAGVEHATLARALALDTVTAAVDAMSCSGVLVVTSDRGMVAALADLGVAVVADPGTGLGAAIDAGLAAVARRGTPRHRGVLLGDLPALRPWDLWSALLATEAHGSAFVPDTGGTGSVLLGAVAGLPLHPRFGPGSARRHELAGHVRLDLDCPQLRTDVDDADSLRAAVGLGVGRHTATLLGDLLAPER